MLSYVLFSFFKAENVLQIAQNCKIFWLTETWNCSEGGEYSPKNLGSIGYYWRCYNHIRVTELHLFQLVPIQLQGCAPEWTVFSLSHSWSKLSCSCVKFGGELSCTQRGWLGYKKEIWVSGPKQAYMKSALQAHPVLTWNSFYKDHHDKLAVLAQRLYSHWPLGTWRTVSAVAY